MPHEQELPIAEHLARPLRVHALAHDFEVLDVWRLPVRVGRSDFRAFCALMADMEAIVGHTSWLTRKLFAVRLGLGRVLGWDEPGAPRPIPGCTEASLRARLPEGEGASEARAGEEFSEVYVDEEEALLELSNDTVHALMHLAWLPEGDGVFGPSMAIYVKHRGALGRSYMALIEPFRRWVVYPSLMSAVGSAWRERAGA